MRPSPGLYLTGSAEWHERPASPARIGHDELLGRPITGDVRLPARTPRRALRRGKRSRRCAFRELPISIDALAVSEHDRVEITRRRVPAVRRSFEGQLLALLEHLGAPTRPSQHRRGAHLAAILRDLPIGSGNLEVDPRVRVDQIQSGKRPGQFHLFRAVERAAAMVGRGWHRQRQENSDDEYHSNHARAPR